MKTGKIEVLKIEGDTVTIRIFGVDDTVRLQEKDTLEINLE